MNQAPDTLPLPLPWQPLTAARAQLLLAELRAELVAGHTLYGVPVHAVAEAVANDDVLFRHCNDPVRFTVVRIAYGGTERQPTVRIDGSWLEFMAGQQALSV